MEISRKDIHNSDIPAVCRSCEARHGGICGALTSEQLTEISKYTTRKKIPANTEVVGQGEQFTAYSNILSGVIKLSKVMSDGRQQIVGLQFAPDFMGRPFVKESSLTAEASTDAEICMFPKRVMERMIAASPDLEHRIHEQTQKELDEARDWMLTLGRKTAREKVASLLFLIASHSDPTAGPLTQFDLPLSRADIADFLGLTIETVSRQMTALRKDGIIAIENNRHVICPDMDRLHLASGNE